MEVNRSRTLLGLSALCLSLAWLLPAATAWHLSADLGHAWTVPLLMAYLWWERWNERPNLVDRSAAPRWQPLLVLLTVCALGLALIPLRLLLALYPTRPMLLATFTLLQAILVLSLAWFSGGRPALRWIGGPLLLVLSTLPIPAFADAAIILPLRNQLASLTAEICNIVGYPAIAHGTSIRMGSGWVGIDEACGGIRSLQACVMLALFFGEWYSFSWLRRSILFLAAILWALLGNFARVLTLSLLAHSGPDTLHEAHDPAGWLAMGLSLALTAWLACHWGGYRWPERDGAATVPSSRKSASLGTFSVRIFGAAVALAVVSEAGTRAWYAFGGIRDEQGTKKSWTVRFPLNDPSFQNQPISEGIRETLQPDHYLAGRWCLASEIFAAGYFVEWKNKDYAHSMPLFHNPTICMPGAGFELLETLPPFIFKTRTGEIPFQSYHFRRAGKEFYMLFVVWDTDRGRPFEIPKGNWEWMLSQSTMIKEAHKKQSAQILALMLPWQAEAPDLAREALTKLIEIP